MLIFFEPLCDFGLRLFTCSSQTDLLQHLSDRFTGSGRLNGSDLGTRFSAEARRLWQLEIGRRNLTTVQALMIMSATSNGEGKDKLGWFYLTTAVRLSLDMQLQRELSNRPSLPGSGGSAHEVRRVRRLTAWGLFYSQKRVKCKAKMRDFQTLTSE